jgi:putative chitinase
MGNGPEDSGDGYKYRGRGYLQITGKANYQRISQLTGIDLIADPSIGQNPQAALLVAAAWWTNAGLNELADANQIEKITRNIGGLPTLSNRIAQVNHARELLEKRK